MADDDAGPTRPADGFHNPGGDAPEPTIDERAAAMLRDAEDAAAARGRAMVNEARAVRQRMLDDLERRRQTLLAELQRVRRALDELTVGIEEAAAAPPAPDTGDAPGGATGVTEPDDVFAKLRAARDQAPPPEAACRRPTHPPSHHA